ncbi:MAG: YicC family protein [bacterium]|nr:YicC family protein [bacterium]
MNSMTGFGKAEVTFKFGRFTVEISSVNSRYLEMSIRLPRGMAILESRVREVLTKSLTRGKLSVWAGFDAADDAPGRFLINRAAAEAYHDQLKEIASRLNISGEISISDLVLLPDIASDTKESIDVEAYWVPLNNALQKSVKQLLSMRRAEGLEMKKDMDQRLKATDNTLTEVVSLTGNAVIRKREKLLARIEELLESPQRESLRIEEEVTVIAERTDIAEECTRLSSHIKQFRKNLRSKEPVGKRLNFILQEMNREANTIASKASDFDISSAVISIKEEVEKIREMVQNVE